jgi:hypothetical protein
MYKLFLMIFLCLFYCSTGYSQNVVIQDQSSAVKKLDVQWVSDSVGEATAVAPLSYTGQAVAFAVIHPTTPSIIPTDLYDINVYNDAGIDILDGSGADIDSSTDALVLDSMGFMCVDFLTVRISNAGSNKSGRFVLYIE